MDFPFVVISPQNLHFDLLTLFDWCYFCLRSEELREQCVVETDMIADTDGDGLSSDCNSNAEDSQPGNSSTNLEQMFLVLFSVFLSLELLFFPQTASF